MVSRDRSAARRAESSTAPQATMPEKSDARDPVLIPSTNTSHEHDHDGSLPRPEPFDPATGRHRSVEQLERNEAMERLKPVEL